MLLLYKCLKIFNSIIRVDGEIQLITIHILESEFHRL